MLNAFPHVPGATAWRCWRTPGPWRRRPRWCRERLCSKTRWWSGTSPDPRCPKSAMKILKILNLYPARQSSNLKLDGLSVKLNSSNFEIYSYRGNVRFCICVIRKSAREINCKSKFRCITQCSPEKETRFPHTGVTNKEELEQVVTEKKKRIKHWSKVFNFVTILPLPTHKVSWCEGKM